MTLKAIKTKVKSVNASLLEMDFSTEEIQDFWQQCFDEVNQTAFTLKKNLKSQVSNLTSND